MEQMSNKYIRLTKSLYDKGILIKPEDRDNHIEDRNKDYYTSLFYYTDEHLTKFKKTGTVKGIRDVKTDQIWFDFDSKTDPELARQDAMEIVSRLKKQGLKDKNIEIYFSGNKGYNVIVNLKRQLTPEQVYSLAINKYGKGLATLDSSMYDSVQILRVPYTKHNVSGLFKIPLTIEQLYLLTVDEVKKLAISLDTAPEEPEISIANPDDSFYDLPVDKNVSRKNSYKLDISQKPAQWKNCKWSLMQGNFKEGERHQALLVIAATCRGLGYDKDTTYYMCKSALKKQSSITGQTEFPKEELYQNIIEQSVFQDGWDGGQYTCKKEGWLQTYCDTLGEHKCSRTEESEKSSIEITEMSSQFRSFAVDFDKNVIRTGIKELDSHVKFLASTHNGVLGQPGSGKTTWALNYLHETSKTNIPSLFLSLDMSIPIIYAKLIQKIKGCDFDEALDIYKTGSKEVIEQLDTEITKQYKNVHFNFTTGLTVSDIKSLILEYNANNPTNKLKLLIIDYLECLQGPYSDPTANFGFISNQLKDVAKDTGVCSVLLLQTQKHSTPDISDPLLTMKAIKGSSIIEQSCSTILTLWREGYNPKTVADDKYISFAVVKNRFGSLWSGDFSWNGVRGEVRSLTPEERSELIDFKERKNAQRAADSQQRKEWE